jgi:hypothetical protein
LLKKQDRENGDYDIPEVDMRLFVQCSLLLFSGDFSVTARHGYSLRRCCAKQYADFPKQRGNDPRPWM